MTSSRVVLPVAVAALLLTGACAQTAGAAGPNKPPATSPAASPTAGADQLVIRIVTGGGFTASGQNAAKIPDLSVYGDGRVITSGPVPSIYPAPALPNILVQKLTAAAAQQYVAQGVDAGVRSGTNFGQPSVVDAPTTTVTVRTAGGVQAVDAQALQEASKSDPRLTAAQRLARTRLAAYVSKLEGLGATATMQVRYEPTTLAAMARPWTPPVAQIPDHPANVRAWPGPALPGSGCVVASGAQGAAALAAAKTANSATAWTSGGKKWQITFRPLLPDETSCPV